MAGSNQEIEVKFYLRELASLERRVRALPAKLCQPRTHELNLRFDTQDGTLSGAFRVLRLRRDTANWLTYKGPGWVVDGVRQREEIEIQVNDFDQARAFLEALGYQVGLVYEKYRAVYDYRGTVITLDETPLGDFAEIEGPDAASVKAISQLLGLDWVSRIHESYVDLYERVRFNLGVPVTHLTFDEFAGIQIASIHLDVQYADRPSPQPREIASPGF